MGWSSHLISIIKAWEYTEWRQRKLEKQMGATCDLIVRTENIALGLPQTSLYRRRTPAAEGAGPRWCVAPLLPWGKDNFPGCPKPQQLLLLLAAPTGLHITQASDLSSGPTSYRDALRFAPAHSLLLKHGCSGYPAWTETHSAMTQLFTGLCEQWAPSRRGNDETSGDGYQAGTISPR